MLSQTPGRQLNAYTPDYVVFDLETTGVSCANDAVIEISAIKVEGGQVCAEFSTLVDPQRPIPYFATQVNNITDEMVQGKPLFREALNGFLNFAGELPLVGHNIHTFDMKFLRRDAMRYWDASIGNDYIDTLTLSRTYLPELAHHRLVDLAEYYGISTVGAHRALNDCRMNQQIFELLAVEMTRAAEKKLPMCPRCGQPLIHRHGRFGPFWGCTAYPTCRYTKNG